MSNLPLDMPDDYPWLPGSGKSQLGDLGEMAVRLGSNVAYDRRGSVLWVEDFRHGLTNITPVNPGSAGTVELVADFSLFNGYSCHVIGSTNQAQLFGVSRLQPSTNHANYGFEVSYLAGGDVKSIQVRITSILNGEQSLGEIRYDVETHDLVYLNSSGVEVEIANIYTVQGPAVDWHTIKLVIDPVNGLYVRALFDRDEYSLTDIALQTASVFLHSKIQVHVFMNSISGSNGSLYLDNLIFTTGDL